jgi:ABC-type antimicrobial peptide transport system permease subunit
MRERRAGFGVGFALTLVLLALVQVLAAHQRSDCGIRAVLALWNLARSGCADDSVRVGFPLVVVEHGGFMGINRFALSALLIDVLLILVVSVVGGLIGATWQVRRRDRQRRARDRMR